MKISQYPTYIALQDRAKYAAIRRHRNLTKLQLGKLLQVSQPHDYMSIAQRLEQLYEHVLTEQWLLFTTAHEINLSVGPNQLTLSVRPDNTVVITVVLSRKTLLYNVYHALAGEGVHTDRPTNRTTIVIHDNTTPITQLTNIPKSAIDNLYMLIDHLIFLTGHPLVVKPSFKRTHPL